MGQEFESPSSSNNRGGARWFESDPAIIIDWQQFHQFLLQRMTPKTAEDRLRYSKVYASVLTSSGIPNGLLQLSSNKRIHVMKALSCLAKYLGCYDRWQVACKQHQLSWSTGTEKLDAFNRFFDSSKDLDTMIEWLREAMAVLPSQYSRFLLFCTLTGLRASECIEAVRLLNGHQITDYYNPEQSILQHYRFPQLFIRRTKAVYISVINDKILSIAQSINSAPTLNAVKMAIKHRCLSMQLKYCRKIYASFLRQQGVQPEIIDMLQGRIGKNIFLRHYLTPSSSYKTEVLKALGKLQSQLQ